MNIIVCLDDKNGMLFYGRRQSSDQLLCQRVLERTKDETLWMNNYSQKLFSDLTDHFRVSDNFLEQCSEDDWCFVENDDLLPLIHKIKKIMIYRWNRTYPRDVVFPDFTLPKPISVFEFSGTSHERITEELYIL